MLHLAYGHSSGWVRAAHVLYSSRADTQLLALQMRVVMLHTCYLK
jgi:hypothetical protein